MFLPAHPSLDLVDSISISMDVAVSFLKLFTDDDYDYYCTVLRPTQVPEFDKAIFNPDTKIGQLIGPVSTKVSTLIFTNTRTNRHVYRK